MAEPRHHTTRDYSRRTLGPVAARIAAAWGRPFMPWQRDAADFLHPERAAARTAANQAAAAAVAAASKRPSRPRAGADNPNIGELVR